MSTSQNIYAIKDRAPEFPCWLWVAKVWDGKAWNPGWQHTTTATGGFHFDATATHWSPDAPEAPKDAPGDDIRRELTKGFAGLSHSASPELPESVRPTGGAFFDPAKIRAAVLTPEQEREFKATARRVVYYINDAGQMLLAEDGYSTPTPSPVAGLPTPESEMKCEGCAATATKRDSEGIPLCEDCYAELKASSVLALDAPETDAVWKACKPKTWQVSFEKMHKHAESLERRLAAARAEVEAERKMRQTMETRRGEVVADLVAVRANYKNVSGHYDEAVRELVPLRAQLATAKAASQGDRDFRLAVEEALAKEAGDTQIDAVEVLVSVLNERDRLRSDLAKANAAVEVLSTARTAIERSLEGAASFDGYYRHHRNAIAMMDKLGVKPAKENNDHGF